MHFSYLDAYFHLASQGNKEGYVKLYEAFRKRCYQEVYYVTNSTKYAEISIDFTDFLDDLFFRSINQYNQDKGSFSYFVEYVVKIRLAPKIKELIYEMTVNDVDNALKCAEHIQMIDLLPDPNQKPIFQEVSINSFKQAMASPNKSRTSLRGVNRKVVLMKYAGYSRKEICEILDISEATLKRILKTVKTIDEITKLKLDLK